MDNYGKDYKYDAGDNSEFERDPDSAAHINVFRSIVADIKAQAVNLEAPIQNRLAADISHAIQWSSGRLSRTEVNALPVDYSEIKRAFPVGVPVPTNIGEATDILTRSQFVGFVDNAMRAAKKSSDPQTAFLESFQSAAANFVQKIGEYDETAGQMPYYGVYATRAAETDRVRAEKRQKRPGTYGLESSNVEDQAQEIDWYGGAQKPQRDTYLYGIPQQSEYLPLGKGKAWKIQQKIAEKLPPKVQQILYNKAIANRKAEFSGLSGDDIEAVGYNEAMLTAEPHAGTDEVIGGQNRVAGQVQYYAPDEGVLRDTAPSVGGANEEFYNLQRNISGRGAEFQQFLSDEINIRGFVKKGPVKRFYGKYQQRHAVDPETGRVTSWELSPVGQRMQAEHNRNYGIVMRPKDRMDKALKQSVWAANKDLYAQQQAEYEAQALAEADAIAAEERRHVPNLQASTGTVYSGGMVPARQRDAQWSGEGPGLPRRPARTPVRAANPPGGSEPPDFPPDMPYDAYPNDDEEPIPNEANTTQPHFRDPAAPEAAWAQGPGSKILSAPTGYGKTSILISHQGKSGAKLGLLGSPLSLLNQQLATRVNDTDWGSSGEKMRAFYLPGYPGKKGKPEKLAEYTEAHNKFYEALGVEFDDRGGHRFTGRGAVAIDPLSKRPTGWRGSPITAVMSLEKMATLPGTRLGGIVSELNEAGLLGSVGIDEAHEISDAGRYQGRYLAESLDQVASNADRLFTSGSFTSEDVYSLQQVHHVSESGTKYVDSRRNPNVHWRSVGSGDNAITSSLDVSGDAPAIVFSSNVGAQRGIVDKLRAAGRQAFRFHKSATVDPLTAEEENFAKEKLAERRGPNGETLPGSGIDRNEVAVMSNAGATGLHRPEVGHVLQQDPYSFRSLTQASGRLRPPQAEGEERFFTISASAEKFSRRERSVRKTQDRISSVNYLGATFMDLRARQAAGEFTGGWQEQAQQMEGVVQERLEAEKLHKYSANNAMAYLEEAGAISLVPGVGPQDEEDFGWQFNDVGSSAVEVGQHLSGKSVKSRTQIDPNTRDYKRISIKQRAREDIEWMAREQQAMGHVEKAATNIRNARGGEAGIREAGEFWQSAKEAWGNKIGGGIEGAEQHIESIIPKELASRYVKAVEAAVKVYEKDVDDGMSRAAANEKYQKAVIQAAQYIKDQPAAASEAEAKARDLRWMAGASEGSTDPDIIEQGRQAQMAADTISRGARGVAGGIPASEGGTPPGDGASGGSPTRGIWGGKVGGLLYGAYIARRMWQMVGAPVIQDMNRYAASEQVTAPLAYYGQSGQMDMTTSAGGLVARQSESEYRMGKAAYSVWGPMADLGASMTTNPAFNRIMQTGRVVAGVEAAGYVLSNTQMLQQLGGYVMGESAAGMAQTAGKIAPFLGKASQALTGVSLGLEGVNLIDQLVKPYTGKEHSTLGEEATLGSAGRFLGRALFAGQHVLDSAIRGGEAAQKSSAEYAEKNPEYWNWLTAPERVSDEMERKEEATSANISRLSLATGRKREEVAGGYAAYQRTIGRQLTETDVDKLATMSKKFLTEGITDQAGINAAASYAEQSGFAIGMEGYEGALDKYAMADQIQQDRMGRTAQRTAGFAGQLTPFMSSLDALKWAREKGVKTQGDVTPVATVLAMADQDRMLDRGTGTIATPDGRQTTYRDDLLKWSQGLTARESNRYMSVADALIGAGATPGMDVYKAAERAGIKTDQEASAATSMISMAGQYGSLSNAQADKLLALSKGYSPAASSIISSQFMSPLFQAGLNVNQVTSIMGPRFGQMSNYQMGLMGQVWSGDLGAQSYAAWKQPQMMQQFGYNPSAYRVADTSGNPIYETNGAAFISMMQGQAAQGNAAAQGITGYSSLVGTGYSPNQIASNLGIQPNRMASYMSGGMRSVQNDIRTDLYAVQDAQAGIGLAQVANQRQFLWGNGSWNNPGPGSMWDLENRQRALSYQSTMANFASQETRMNTNNQFAIRQENLQQERMGVSNDYQRFNLDIGRQQQLLQRDYQAQVRSLQWQWKTEDYGEEVRFMTGRQRRLAERQMGRDTTMHNLEGNQIEAQNAIEDKRYQKSAEYTNKMIELEQKQFDLNKEHRETMFKLDQEDFARHKKEFLEQKKLEDEIIALQRKHQKDQLDFQAAQAALQKQEIKLQRELEAAARLNAQAFGDVRGELEQINRYGNVVPVLNSVKSMLLTADSVDLNIIKKIDDLLKKLTSGTATSQQPSSQPNQMIPDQGVDNGTFSFVPLHPTGENKEIKVNLVIDGTVFQSFIIDTVSGELK